MILKATKTPHCKLITIAGGKGGVGRTSYAVNLASILAVAKIKTLLIDLDPGQGDIATHLGIRVGDGVDYNSHSNSIEDYCQATPLDALKYIRSDSRTMEFFQKENETLGHGLLEAVRDSDIQYAIVDLGSGLTDSMLEFYVQGDIHLCITDYERTAMEEAYWFLKNALLYSLHNMTTSAYLKEKIETIRADVNDKQPFMEKISRFTRFFDPDLANKINELRERYQPRIVINRVGRPWGYWFRNDYGWFDTKDRFQSAVAKNIITPAREELGVKCVYLGHLRNASVRLDPQNTDHAPAVVRFPSKPFTHEMISVVRRLLVDEPAFEPFAVDYAYRVPTALDNARKCWTTASTYQK